MSTIASLVRAHERNAANLYVAPSSNRESSPGRYDQTATQKSPALERRQIRDAARAAAGRIPELAGQDLGNIGDYEDLQEKLEEIRNPGVDVPEVPEVELPTVETPEFPAIPPSTFPADSHRLTVLHSGHLSVSTDAGAKWLVMTGSPAAPVGFAAPPGSPVLVATANAVYRSQDLVSWTPVEIPGPSETEIYLENGDFEDYTNGWTLVSGDTPRTQATTSPPQKEGSANYLTRDWVVAGNGAFEIRQAVSVPPEHATAPLRIAADMLAGPGATASVVVSTPAKGLDLFANPDPAGVKSGNGTSWMCRGVAVIDGAPVDARVSISRVFSDSYRYSVSHRKLHFQSGADWEFITLRFEFRDQAGNPVEVGGSFDVKGLVSGPQTGPNGSSARVIVFDTALDSIESLTGVELIDATSGDGVGVIVPPNTTADVRVTVQPTKSFRLYLVQRLGKSLDILPSPSEAQIEIARASITGGETWAAMSDEFVLPDGAASVDVSVVGSGSPANVWIDNVKLLAGAGEADPAISAIDRNSTSTSIADRDRLIRIGPDGTATEQQKYPTQATELAYTLDGQPFALCQFGVMTPAGRIVGGGGDPFVRLVGGDYRFLAIRASGALCAVEDTDERTITPVGQLPAGSSVHYSPALIRFIAVAPAGQVKASQDGATWSDMPPVPVKSAHSGMRILTAPSGRLYCYAPGWSSMAFLEPGSSAWKVSGKFAAPIVDLEIS